MNIDDTIREVERLYKSVTGSDVPPEGDAPYAAIPPEVDPQRYVESQVERLTHMLASDANGGASAPRPPTTATFAPPLSVIEHESVRVYLLDVPGVRRKDVEVSLERGALVVRGERVEEREDGATLRWRETPTGRFERVVALPHNVDEEELSVSLKDGCLEIRVPLKAAPSSSKTIQIR